MSVVKLMYPEAPTSLMPWLKKAISWSLNTCTKPQKMVGVKKMHAASTGPWPLTQLIYPITVWHMRPGSWVHVPHGLVLNSILMPMSFSINAESEFNNRSRRRRRSKSLSGAKYWDAVLQAPVSGVNSWFGDYQEALRKLGDTSYSQRIYGVKANAFCSQRWLRSCSVMAVLRLTLASWRRTAKTLESVLILWIAVMPNYCIIDVRYTSEGLKCMKGLLNWKKQRMIQELRSCWIYGAPYR